MTPESRPYTLALLVLGIGSVFACAGARAPGRRGMTNRTVPGFVYFG